MRFDHDRRELESWSSSILRSKGIKYSDVMTISRDKANRSGLCDSRYWVLRILKGDEGVKLKAFYTAMTALSLVAAPTIAAAAPVATPLTQPAIDSSDGDNALAGGGFLIAALAVVAVGLGIYAVADSDDSPNSP